MAFVREHSCNFDAMDFTTFKFSYLRNEDVILTAKDLLSAKFRDSCLALHSTSESIKTLEKGAKYQSYLPKFLAEKVEMEEKLRALIERILSLTGRKKCAMCVEDFAKKEEMIVFEHGERKEVTKERERVKTKCCRTLFCTPCLNSWVEKTPWCPKCSSTIEHLAKDVDVDVDTVEPESANVGLLDKMEEFEKVLDKEVARENSRVLIFSDMSGTFIEVQNILKKKGILFAEIEGNQYTMDRAMADFKSGKRPVLLVDAQSYGAGMNMEMTSAVIIMHKTERENQIIGRAQRLGRTDRLYVHHLVYPGE